MMLPSFAKGQFVFPLPQEEGEEGDGFSFTRGHLSAAVARPFPWKGVKAFIL